jgi:signal peptidase
MRPAVDVGDLLIVSKVPVDSIKKGDIIEYLTEDKDIFHRVIAIEQTGGGKLFTTKGDANNAPDEAPVSPQQIKGKAVLVVPKLGWVSIKIKSLLGLL